HAIFSLTLRRPPTSPLFPYTTLFRSLAAFVPVRRLTRVGVQSGVAYASENWTPLRANFLKLGKTEISCHPRSSTRNTMMLGLGRSEEHTSELQSRENLVCRLLLEKKN